MKKWLATIIILLFVGCYHNKIIIIRQNTLTPLTAHKGDSYVFLDNLLHRPTIKYIVLNNNNNNSIKIIIKTKIDDIDKINLILDGKKYPMKSVGIEDNSEIFSVNIQKVINKKINYYFEIIDGKFRYFYAAKSSYYISKIVPFSYRVGDKLRKLPSWAEESIWYSIYIDTFRDGTKNNNPIYSEYGPSYYFRPIDRLSDGTIKSELIPQGRWQTLGHLKSFQVNPWGSDWNLITYSESAAKNRYFNNNMKNIRRYGGDFQGIIQKLDYLKKLGINGLNLSPIFYSNSGNKLDTIDYGHISPDYAKTSKNSYIELKNALSSDVWTNSDKFFQNLVNEIHKKQMKIVCEINFSYVSSDFFALKDVIKNGPNSKYRDWFIINSWNGAKNSKDINNWNPYIKYNGNSTNGVLTKNGEKFRRKWVKIDNLNATEDVETYFWNKKNLDYKNLGNRKKVVLNLKNRSLQNYLIKSTVKWVKGQNNSGIDGYYVKNSIPNKTFLKKWKRSLLLTNNKFILVGEITKQNEKNIGRDGFDVIASYNLGKYLNTMLKSSNIKINQIIKSYNNIPHWNMMDSYDTDRFFSSLVNNKSGFDRLNNYGIDDYINIRPDIVDPNAIKKLKLAILIQLTIGGSPVIYYGSEQGMWGADAPDSRKPMLWNDIKYKQETDSLKKYSKNRNKLAALFHTNMRKNTISYDVQPNKKIYKWYKNIIEFRDFDRDLIAKGNTHILDLDKYIYLKDGNIKKIEQTDVLAYEREYQNRSAIIAINRSGLNKVIEIPVTYKKGYTDFYLGSRYRVIGDIIRVKLAPYSSIVLYRKIKI